MHNLKTHAHTHITYVLFLYPGPNVSFSCSVVDFGCVEEGEACVRTVEVVNSSPAEAIYQWDLDCSGHSVFTIQPASGILNPYSHTRLKAVYRPTQPLSHHRRVACLLLHRVGVYVQTQTHSQSTHPHL